MRTLSLVSASVLTGFYFLTLFRKKGFWMKKGLSLMTAGAWSNTVDRCAKGYVVDYVGFRCGNEKISAVTYNLGDFFLASGGVISAAAALFRPQRQNRRRE